MNIGFILPILVTLAGTYLLIKLRAFFIFHPIRVTGIFARELGCRASRRSLALALAGTLGVGNIFGVSAGLIVGGAGSVFWLAVSSLFAMIIKYAETALSVYHSSDGRGGMYFVMNSQLPKYGRALSMLYAAVCLVLALSMGFFMQSASLVTVAKITLDIPSSLGVFILVLLLLPSVLGGGDKIEKITAFAIPLTTVIYILMSFCVIFMNFSRLPEVLSDIINGAFSVRSAGGGILAFLSSSALTEGYSRGILSNESGTGTSSMAHSRADGRAPSVAGLYGICEVFFDTLVLCILTALAILTSIKDISSFSSPMALVTEAFVGTLGIPSGVLLFICIFLFAYSTIVCWFYYGGECAYYLFGRRSSIPFLAAFIIFVVLGAHGESAFMLSVTDLAILVMSALSLFTVLSCAETVKKLTEESGLLSAKNKVGSK